MGKKRICLFFALLITGTFLLTGKTAAADGGKTTTVTISAAGDCTFGSDASSPASVNFYSVYRKVHKNPAYFFKKVRNIFAEDDLTIVNFEGTLTKRTTRMDKTYAFKGHPSYADILKKGAIEAVSFANNHCRDFGTGSYQDTISVFKKKGITYASYAKAKKIIPICRSLRR